MISIEQGVKNVKEGLKEPTDSSVIHLKSLSAAGKFFMTPEWNQQTSFMFWLESIAIVAFGISWLTKAEVILADSVATT